ncbi:MAG: flavodoxin family protein [Candidatus Brocadiia bacterium]
MRILNLYASLSGNTARVARAVTQAAEDAGHEVHAVQAPTDEEVDVLGYDFVFLGTGVYQWLPAKPLMELLNPRLRAYREAGEVRLACPKRPGKKAAVYCTYGGPHTGVAEAVPAAKWLGQFLEHLGFDVLAEWYVVGEFHGKLAANNTGGRLGDIRGRPTEEDLRRVAEQVAAILRV